MAAAHSAAQRGALDAPAAGRGRGGALPQLGLGLARVLPNLVHVRIGHLGYGDAGCEAPRFFAWALSGVRRFSGSSSLLCLRVEVLGFTHARPAWPLSQQREHNPGWRCGSAGMMTRMQIRACIITDLMAGRGQFRNI